MWPSLAQSAIAFLCISIHSRSAGDIQRPRPRPAYSLPSELDPTPSPSRAQARTVCNFRACCSALRVTAVSRHCPRASLPQNVTSCDNVRHLLLLGSHRTRPPSEQDHLPLALELGCLRAGSLGGPLQQCVSAPSSGDTSGDGSRHRRNAAVTRYVTSRPPRVINRPQARGRVDSCIVRGASRTLRYQKAPWLLLAAWSHPVTRSHPPRNFSLEPLWSLVAPVRL